MGWKHGLQQAFFYAATLCIAVAGAELAAGGKPPRREDWERVLKSVNLSAAEISPNPDHTDCGLRDFHARLFKAVDGDGKAVNGSICYGSYKRPRYDIVTD